MTNPFMTRKDEAYDAIFDAAYTRASALDAHYQAIVDSAAVILAAIDKLKADNADHGLPYAGMRLMQIGVNDEGEPVFGMRPGKGLIDLDEIACALERVPSVDVGNAIFDQAKAWATAEWEDR